MGSYLLKCLSCNLEKKDNYKMNCSCGKGGFYRAVYSMKYFDPKTDNNIWKFAEWLPIESLSSIKTSAVNTKTTAGKCSTFKSINLAKELGLENLYIAFNGYWPERNGNLLTGTFKGLEAPPSILRAKEKGIKRILVASAGNTGRAFAEETLNQDFEIIIVAAHSANSRLWTTQEVNENNVKYISLAENNDYTDAIDLGKRICSEIGIETEGGASNIARRDGMGTCLLESVCEIGKLPDHYFQAVGSGTGGIAAWEASLRLLGDGRFGNLLPKLHLSQNADFAPIVNAWNARRGNLIEEDFTLPREKMSSLYAEVLANRKPPYSIDGGVYQALTNTNGEMYSISEKEALEASELMLETEEIDIVPPAAIAVGSLIKSVNLRKINPRDTIVLNITGGGITKLKEDFNLIPIKPIIEVKNSGIVLAEIEEILSF